MNAQLGVVVPAWNAEGTITAALDSIHRQTIGPVRVIVIDDGSVDATADRARSRGAEVIVTEHAGAARARNVGVAALDTRYVAFLDADDRWPDDYLHAAGPALEAGADLVVADRVDVDAELGPMGRTSIVPTDLRLERLVRHNPMSASNVIARRQLVLDVGGFDGDLTYGQDTDLWLRMVAAGAEVGQNPSFVYYTTRSSPDPLEKLLEVERCRRLRLSRLEALPIGPETRQAAEQAARLDLARRYLRSGYGEHARRCLRGVRGAPAAGLRLLALLPPERLGHLRQLSRRCRRWRATATAASELA